MNCPSHLAEFAEDAAAQFPGVADQYHSCFRVRCLCGGTSFQVHKGTKPSLIATCAACNRRIVVYDVSLYPAASPRKGKEEYHDVTQPGRANGVEVFVMFEYGELDGDQEFDQNDVSWCQVFIQDARGNRVKVLDDETA